jgi:hypothetical protein
MAQRNLTLWTKINKDFAKGSRLTQKKWLELINSKAVAGKIIGDTPYIDADHFAGNINPQVQEKIESTFVNLLE